MGLGELARTGAVEFGGHAITLEIAVLVFAAAMAVALFFAKARRARVQKLRKAASSGYYDFDVARYGGTAPGRSLIDAIETTGPQSLASTFSAPTSRRGSRRKGGSSADPPPIPPPPFAARPPQTGVASASAPLPPPPGSPSAPLPPPPPGPSAVAAEDKESEGSALPLLVPPPPPAPASSIPPPPRG